MLKFALVGCGRIAKRHADLLGENKITGAQLIAVVDKKMKRARAIGDSKNVPAYDNMHEMMDIEKPNVVTVLTESALAMQSMLLNLRSTEPI